MKTAITNPIALRALENALKAARSGPAPRQKVDSRIADKFVVRGFSELFAELSGIGLHHGRSANSEMVAGILEGITGFVRANHMLKILKKDLGDDMAQRVLAEVPTFDLEACKTPDKFVIRFPPQIRDTVRDDVQRAIASKVSGGPHSMNQWLLKVLVEWVRIQRQHYALLSASIAHERELLGFSEKVSKAD
jgi:hypothetical protein